MASYDRFYAFTFFVGGTVSTFLDIIFPNKYCSTFLKYCIKRLSFTVEYNGESADSSRVRAEVRPSESGTCSVAKECSSGSINSGYDKVSHTKSDKSESDGDCVSVKGDDELGPRPLCS
jgi:hypothetical protein